MNASLSREHETVKGREGEEGKGEWTQPSSFSAYRHLGEHGPDRLVLNDWNSKRLAVVRVLGRLGETPLRETDRARRDERSRNVERAHRNLETVAWFAEDVLFRDHNVFWGAKT